MAEEASAPARGGTRKWLGFPWWYWAIGAAVVVGGYWYISNGGGLPSFLGGGTSSGTTTSGSGTSAPTGLSTQALELWLADHQIATAPATKTKTVVKRTPAPADVPQLHSTGKFDLQKIATGHGLTEKQLLQLNPQLRKYAGTGRPVPKGTLVRLR